MLTYYEILQVSSTTSMEEIKHSYRKLAKEHHPDKGGDKEIFQNIQTAYETLSDEHKRREYDMSLQFKNLHAMPPNFNNGHNFPFNIFHFFNESNLNKKIKKPDEIYNCKITLDEVFSGCKRNFHIKRETRCEECSVFCFECGGIGMKNQGQRIQIGGFLHVNNLMCQSCYGNGLLRKLECPKCNNSGFITKDKFIELLIPKGVESGKKFSFEGWGLQSLKATEISGNFVVNIIVEDHVHFKRNNLDLIYETDITLKESILGKEIIIPYFNNEVITFNTKNYGIIDPTKEYILGGKGITSETGDKGNMCIKFKIRYIDIKLSDDKIKELEDVLDGIFF